MTPTQYFVKCTPRLLLAILLWTTVFTQQALAAPPENMADQCFKRAERYEREANRYANDVRDPGKWFDLAMKNYLCAANAGHVMAKWRVVNLSGSGQVEALPKETEDRLLREAAEAGLPEAQIGMYTTLCDNVGTQNACKNPVEGEKWLLKAVRVGNPDATFLLGAFHEKGEGGKDTDRTSQALACYRLAFQRYRSAMKGKRGEDLRQLKSDLEMTGRGIERVLRRSGGREVRVSCY